MKVLRDPGLVGFLPAQAALTDAPLLVRWHVADERSDDGAALFGVRARDRARIETDTVYALDVKNGWALIKGGGLYRLGEPADPTRTRHPSLLAWTPAILQRAQAIGFELPPAELVPTGPLYDDTAAWNRLAAWYDERASPTDDEVLLYLALRMGCTPSEAYVYSDSWAKSRLGMRGFN
jgi:hypothetical protein